MVFEGYLYSNKLFPKDIYWESLGNDKKYSQLLRHFRVSISQFNIGFGWGKKKKRQKLIVNLGSYEGLHPTYHHNFMSRKIPVVGPVHHH